MPVYPHGARYAIVLVRVASAVVEAVRSLAQEHERQHRDSVVCAVMEFRDRAQRDTGTDIPLALAHEICERFADERLPADMHTLHRDALRRRKKSELFPAVWPLERALVALKKDIGIGAK